MLFLLGFVVSLRVFVAVDHCGFVCGVCSVAIGLVVFLPSGVFIESVFVGKESR